MAPTIDPAVSCHVCDDVLHVRRRGGQRLARVHRAVFVGAAVGWGAAVVGVAAGFLLATPGPRPVGEVLALAVGGVAVWAALMVPTVLFRRASRGPHRLTLSRRGLELRGLGWREAYLLDDIRRLRTVPLKTHSRIAGGGRRLEAELRSGGALTLMDSWHDDSAEQFAEILDFFDRLKGSPSEPLSAPSPPPP